MGKIADIFEGDYPINWDLARTELDLIIFRATVGLKEDKRYIKYAKDSKVPYGVYHYVTATTAEDSREQARFFVEHANKAYKKPLFYIADIEGDRFNSTNTEPVCIAFLEELRKLGCEKIGMYINRKYKYAGKAIEMCDIMWIPHWGKDDGNIPPDSSKPKHYNDLWQYTSNGTLAGLNEDVDLNLINGDKPLEWFIEGWESDKEEEKSMYDKFSNMHFVEFCKKFVGMPYWYATCVYPCTESKLNSKTKNYPDHYTSDRMSRYRADIAAHKICADCVGLMKGYAWTNAGENVIESIGKEKPLFTNSYKSNNMPDKSANGMFSYAKKQGLDWGNIDTLPEIPGLGLHMDGHVGVYIGNGEAIEERGFKYGCVKTKMKDRKWLHWFKIPTIIYQENQVIPSAEILGETSLKNGSKGNAVKELQKNLNLLLGLNLEVDGIFGKKTELAVKTFQNEYGLEIDGIYSEQTHIALMAALSDLTTEEEKQQEEVVMPEPINNENKYITKASVNVRTGDGTSYEKITHLEKNIPINVVLDKDNKPIISSNGWYAIYIMDKIGWLSGNYVKKNT